MDSDQPPPQRPRTEGGQPEVPPPPPENPPQIPPPPSGGGGLAGAFSRTGVPDTRDPPRDPPGAVNSQTVPSMAAVTFKPRWLQDLTPETVAPFLQNRLIAIQTGAASQFPVME